MFTTRIKGIALAIAIGITLPVFAMAPSHAETFAFAKGPLTNLDPAGATVNGGFTAFPKASGMYIQECVAPVGTARPVTCSDTIQLWVTTTATGPGTAIPTGPIAIKVAGSITGKGTTVDCTMTSCGLFFRLDHLAPNDFSEDKFFPITFKSGAAAPALATDTVDVTLNGTALVRNVPSNLGYRAKATIVATAKSGLPVTLTSLTPECAYSNGQFTALKGVGQCALAYSTTGNTTTAAATGNFPFMLVPGTQTITGVKTLLKKGSTKALPLQTNFGVEIAYKSTNKNCIVEANLVQAKKTGSCVIKASAPAKADMWSALATTLTIPVK